MDPGAVQFCAIGALTRSAMQLAGPTGFAALARAVEVEILCANGLTDASLVEINDRDGYERIIAMFECALSADSANKIAASKP